MVGYGNTGYDPAAAAAGAMTMYTGYKSNQWLPYFTKTARNIYNAGKRLYSRYTGTRRNTIQPTRRPMYGRPFIGRGTLTGQRLRDAGPAGRTLTYRKKKRRGGRRLQRGRVRRYRNFRTMLNKALNPRLSYLINYTNKVDQSYNRRKWQVMDYVMNNSNLQAISSYLLTGAYSAANWFFLDNVKMQFQLYNASNSETYVTCYLMKCVDQTTSTFPEWLNADYVAGNTVGHIVPTASSGAFEDDRAASLNQYQQWRKYWKIVKSKYIKMEGGGTTSVSWKLNFKRGINPLVQRLDAADNYYKGLTHCIVLEVRSQIVKNTGAGGILWDNATIGYGSSIKTFGGPMLQTTRRSQNLSATYVAAATPEIITDVKTELA